MGKSIFLYALGDLSEYMEVTYIYNSEKRKSKLPILWLCEKLGNVEKIVFIITRRSQKDYYSLFEKLCEFLINKEIEDVFEKDTIKNFKRKENYDEHKSLFCKALKSKTNFEYDFLIIDEDNLLSFVAELKKFMEKHIAYTFHIDITHGYRFIPMFLTIVVSLLKNAGLSIKVGEILYAFGESSTDNRIISLKEYMDVIDWSHGIFTFKSSANIRPIAEVLQRMMGDISNVMNTLQSSLDMNLAISIKESLNELKDKLKNYKPDISLFSLTVKEEIERMFNELNTKGSQSEFELSLAKWHLKNRWYLHGYTALVEAFKSKLCEIYGYEPNDKKYRKCINDIYNQKIKNLITSLNEGNQIIIFFEKLSEIRNTFAHLNEPSNSELYEKSVQFAQDFNPSHITDGISFSSIDDIFGFIQKQLPEIFSTDEMKRSIKEQCKNIKGGGYV